MTLRVRQWRKRQRELDQLLCYSGSDEEGIEIIATVCLGLKVVSAVTVCLGPQIV